MEEWLQVLRDELQRYDDEDLRYWPGLWWKELHREGMNPLQAIRYTKQAISGFGFLEQELPNMTTTCAIGLLRGVHN